MGQWSVFSRAIVVGVLPSSLLAQLPAPTVQDYAIQPVVQAGTRPTNPLDIKVSLRLHDVPIKAALDIMMEQSGVRIAYSPNSIPLSRKVSVSGNMTLGSALQQVLAGTSFSAQRTPAGYIVIAEGPRFETKRSQGVIIGKVVHAKTKQPLAGVRILLPDGTAATTAQDGTFRLTAPIGEQTLQARMVGYGSVTQKVAVPANETVMVELVLDPNASVLDQVIVTGTVVETQRKAIPTPITVITAEDIARRGITRIDQLFRGEIPGVVALDRGIEVYNLGVFNQTSDPTSALRSDVYVRGSADMNGGTNPLKTYVDGVELANPALLATIDPQSIEKIEIVTGPQAATLYGSGAMGGVMQIFTKRGRAATAPDFTLALRYGMLENNMSSGKTPTHQHNLNMTGGAGPAFSYNGSVSYNYTGQWQPELFTRGYGGSVGATHTSGPVKVDGSVSLTSQANGTTTLSLTGTGGGAFMRARMLSGEWGYNPGLVGFGSQRVSHSASQMLSLNADYRIGTIWQHHVTIGRNQSESSLVPEGPRFSEPSDTLYWHKTTGNRRTTLGYNTTLTPSRFGPLTTTLTLGLNGSSGGMSDRSGCLVTKTGTTLLTCTKSNLSPEPVSVTQQSDESWGGFGSWRLGLYEAFFLTGGLRGEKNPNYGEAHKIDWTPTVGATYALAYREVTVKFLVSYGRATRAPHPSSRLQEIVPTAGMIPSQYERQRANPDLTPEYSSGPQGGVEVYVGNRGSFSVNRFRQTIRDLIQAIPVDTTHALLVVAPGLEIPIDLPIIQNINAGTMRQEGWEVTGTANVAMLSVRGAYSWVRSIIVESRHPAYQLGRMVGQAPTHTGSVGISYAYGPTSVSMTTSLTGRMNMSAANRPPAVESRMLRYRFYGPRYDINAFSNTQWAKNGSAKSDLTVMHQMTSWASLTLNVMNLGNNYASDLGADMPTLGRRSLFGVSLRTPRK